jgi:opacity protein-like surface antigen
MPVSKEWSVQFGAGYKRFDFGSTGTVGGTPQNLEVASLDLGASYRLDEKWTLFSMVTPELDGVNGDYTYLHVGGAVGYVYQYRPNLTLTAGLAINPGGIVDYPVMLIGGIHWKISDVWTLDLGLPRSAIDYAVTDKLHVWCGPSFEGGLFRTSSDYGNPIGRPDLDGRKVSYREIRVGVGADYALTSSISIGAQVGSAVYREFEFKDDNTKVHADPAPFGQLGVKVAF